MKERTATKADGVLIGVFFTLMLMLIVWAVYGVYRSSVVTTAGAKACEDVGQGAWHVDVVNVHKARAFCGTGDGNIVHVVMVDVP